MADEINPRTGKPYSKNPRAVSARRKRQLKVSEAANERQAELDLQQPENQPGTGNILTPEQIEINKKGLEEAKKKIREGGTVKIPEDGKNPLMIKRDPTTQQGINRDKIKNQTGDQILDPEGNFKKGVYKRPSLEQLRRRAALGIKTTGQVLNAISPSKTTLGIGAGILSLLINNPTRRLGGAM